MARQGTRKYAIRLSNHTQVAGATLAAHPAVGNYGTFDCIYVITLENRHGDIVQNYLWVRAGGREKERGQAKN